MDALPDVLSGRVAWIFGDDFDVDLIIGVDNIGEYDPDVLRSVCMSSFDTDFVDDVRAGDVVVGARNFGYGHPHYPAMISMRNAGIVAVVAESFSPGFWRGETYNGMPLVTVPGIHDAVERWDEVKVDWPNARVELPTGKTLTGEPPNERTVEVLNAGGSYNLLRTEYAPEHHEV